MLKGHKRKYFVDSNHNLHKYLKLRFKKIPIYFPETNLVSELLQPGTYDKQSQVLYIANHKHSREDMDRHILLFQ